MGKHGNLPARWVPALAGNSVGIATGLLGVAAGAVGVAAGMGVVAGPVGAAAGLVGVAAGLAGLVAGFAEFRASGPGLGPAAEVPANAGIQSVRGVSGHA